MIERRAAAAITSPMLLTLSLLVLVVDRVQSQTTLPPQGVPNLSGPNTCGFGTQKFCCPGWTMRPGTQLCLTPLCRSPCGPSGMCSRPNLCQCSDGSMGPTCQQGGGLVGMGGGQAPGCSSSCMNGGHCIADRCVCPFGFLGMRCEQAVCSQPCLNGGQCIGFNRCSCPFGFAGTQCEFDFRTGPCFTKVDLEKGVCRSQLQGVMCTREICCASVGRGWGIPCKTCPDKPEKCQRGYMMDPKTKQCEDINECRYIPNVCAMGTCINTVGSFKCECGAGRLYNPDKNECSDIDECTKRPNVCRNGNCQNLDGGFRCTCNPGYVASSNEKYCLKDEPPTQCYLSYSDGLCSNMATSPVTRTSCCCLVGGKATGTNCERCPEKGSRGFQEMCEDIVKETLPNQNGDNGKGKSTDGSQIGQLVSTVSPGGPGIGPGTITGSCDCVNGRCIADGSSTICACNDGYYLPTGERTVCRDIDECRNDPNLCKNGRCVNVPGGYMCECQAGHKMNAKGIECEDVNECSNSKVCQNGQCINTPGSFLCHCPKGHTLINQVCTDIDECAANRSTCKNGVCVNTVGSFRCTCQEGYQYSDATQLCEDINECKREDVCENGRCINSDGSFQCICNPGFVLNSEENGCRDVDECALNSDLCFNGRCQNTPGSYECVCSPAFEQTPDKRHCVDTRQDFCFFQVNNDDTCGKPSQEKMTISQCCCASNNFGQIAFGITCDLCPVKNTEEYERLCAKGPGLLPDGTDIDECQHQRGVNDICMHGQCKNSHGDYECTCNPGFKHPADDDRKSCIDIDECYDEPALCMNGRCTNSMGGYSCQCNEGYRFNPVTKICDDINECENNLCIGGRCINTPGSYQCDCAKGLVLVKGVCRDLRKGRCWLEINNEVCEHSANGPVSRELCCSTVGIAWGSPCEKCSQSSRQCPVGFALMDTDKCVDVDECALFEQVCKNGRCTNTVGSFKCTCPSGYTLDASGKNCIDNREAVCYTAVTRFGCEAPVEGRFKRDACCCSPAGKAWGSPCEVCPLRGSPEFNELCPFGSGRDSSDKDIDECELMKICKNGKCINVKGSFTCECQPGYALDFSGTQCTDINECEITAEICGVGTCVNTPGSFSCICPVGYKSDQTGEGCIDDNECDRNPCVNGRCINSIGSFSCSCPVGTRLLDDGTTCEDDDECAAHPPKCKHGRCENYVGGYQCTCNEGFQPVDFYHACEDVDECQLNRGGCQHFCNNTLGSYHCLCPQGLKIGRDGKTCRDIDECTDSPGLCGPGNTCSNTHGGFFCTCRPGFLHGSDSKSCLDIDECKEVRNACQNGICHNTPGSFHCECPTGFLLDSAAQVCKDIDECSLTQNGGCHSDANCINTPGGFNCTCRDGYTGDGKTCQDIDECALDTSSCSPNALCINIIGGFLCNCKAGYAGDGRSCNDIDECSADPNACEHGVCINLLGTHECDCFPGYVRGPDNKSCEDLDECESFGKEVCHNGICENMIGQFRCVCNKGFELDNYGANCTDINECAKVADVCKNGKCVNEEGSHRCVCDRGFTNFNSSRCIDIRKDHCYATVSKGSCSQLVAQDVTQRLCCCSGIGRGWGIGCELCPSMGSDEFKELCLGELGKDFNINTGKSEDIDECKVFPGLCNGGRCTNTDGSYKCECPAGYKFDNDKLSCVDVNECDGNPYVCGFEGQCVNTVGSYMCRCRLGAYEDPVTKRCRDFNRHSCYRDEQVMRDQNISICTDAFSMNFTISQCCCIAGFSFMRDEKCELCPEKGSDAYKALCSKDGRAGGGSTDGSGKGGSGKDRVGISEGGSELGTTDPDTGSQRTKRPGPTNSIDATGSTGDIEGGLEEDNPCKLSSDLCKNGTCVPKGDSFICQCEKGLRLDKLGRTCLDINECLEKNPCLDGVCRNTFGSFVCDCPPGYTPDRSRVRCVDLDECRHSEYCYKGRCQNTIGSFRCDCRAGYRFNGKTCIDINECDVPGICGRGQCINVEGSYRCHCGSGYAVDSRGVCRDIDECRTRPNVCRYGRCINIDGSYECQCLPGYKVTPDKSACFDINECTEIPGYCRNGICSNQPGKAKCECNEGYKLTSSGDTCIDIDECSDNADACMMNGQCLNTEGGYHCVCPEGYRLSENKKNCQDVRMGVCFAHLLESTCASARGFNTTKALCCCTNSAGWGDPCELCPIPGTKEFQFYCPDGPGVVEQADVDECAAFPNLCQNGRCVNTDGSYRCVCQSGYKLDTYGEKCLDINECTDRIGICGNGTCTNTVGSYQCDCLPGFKAGRTPSCEDINECMEQGRCAHRCENFPGGYRCACPRGYELADDEKHCKDIDECKNKNLCPYDCRNVIGSYICLCPQGMRSGASRDECDDINECAEDPNICGPGGTCINTKGSHRCDCIAPYVRSPDGKSCRDQRQGYCYSVLVDGLCEVSLRPKVRVTKKECCCRSGKAWGTKCETCPGTESADYQKLCIGALKEENVKVNECEMLAGVCANGKCIDLPESYRCICNHGYELDASGTKCININECLVQRPCQHDCIDTNGSFACSCPKGYVLNLDKRTCSDEDECATNQHTCLHKCENTIGSYKCVCPEGYEQKGSSCVDKNECLEGDICGGGICKNTAGSYECSCGSGLQYDKNKGGCVDVDECSGSSGMCQYGCQNLYGSFRCGCPPGYTPHYYWTQCVDENECSRPNICGQSSCQNTMGSYKCGCPSGYTFSPTSMSCQDINECQQMGSTPCSYGCQNQQGGYQCTCPPNFHPVGNGNCISLYGQSCFNCEGMQIPEDGVPIEGSPKKAPPSNNSPVEDTVSIVGPGPGPVSSFYSGSRSYMPTSMGYGSQAGVSLGGMGGYQPNQEIQSYGGYEVSLNYGSSAGYQPTGVNGASAQTPFTQQIYPQSFAGYQDPSVYAGSQQMKYYDQSSGYGYRLRRSAERPSRPLELLLSSKKCDNLTLAEFISARNDTRIRVELETADTVWFEVEHDDHAHRLKAFKPPPGRYLLKLRSKQWKVEEDDYEVLTQDVVYKFMARVV